MGEGAEGLSPDDAEVADALNWDLGEDAVEDVAEEMHGEADHYGFAAFVTGSVSSFP